MREILTFLAEDGAFLYEQRNCRIIDSEYIDSFGGCGSVTLRNDLVKIKFWLDRDQLTMDLCSCHNENPDFWFSIDILFELITGEVSNSGIMNRDNIEFLKNNFESIESRFTSVNLESTQKVCRELERKRAKRLFG